MSSERPGGREGEDGSSRPRGFFGLGGTAESEGEVTGGVATEEDVTGGTEESERQRDKL